MPTNPLQYDEILLEGSLTSNPEVEKRNIQKCQFTPPPPPQKQTQTTEVIVCHSTIYMQSFGY